MNAGDLAALLAVVPAEAPAVIGGRFSLVNFVLTRGHTYPGRALTNCGCCGGQGMHETGRTISVPAHVFIDGPLYSRRLGRQPTGN